jgi:acyl carrier protein
MSSLEAGPPAKTAGAPRTAGAAAEILPRAQPAAASLAAAPPATAISQETGPAPEVSSIAGRVKRLIVDNLHLDGLTPERIDEQAPLFGEGLGLDSVDALELVVAVEKEFGIKIKSNEIGREVFSSVASLSRFIAGRV